MESWKVGDYDLSSRIVKDLNLNFSYSEKDAEFQTSAGPAFPLTANWFTKTLLVKTKDRISNLFLGQPITYSRTINLNNVDVVGDKDLLSCEIDSPWAKITRKLKDVRGQIQIQDNVVVKQKVVPNKMLRSNKFASFQQEIRRCFDGSAIIYRPRTKAVLTKK